MSQLLDKIIEAKEKLGDRQAEIIAEGYPLEQWNPERGSAKSIFNQNDNTPSMMWEKRNYYFKDFSTGKVFGILDYYMHKYNEPYLKSVKRLLDETGVEYEPSLFNFNSNESKDYFKNYIYPHEEQPANDTVIAYMAKRGISERTCRYAGIGSDAHNNVVYNFHDINGRLVTVKYRPSHAIRPGEAKYFYQKDASTCPMLYNINKVDPTKPLLVTEGMNDTLAVIEAGFTNVVSIPSGAEDLNWIELCYQFIDQCEELILWYDNDEAGQNGLSKVVQRLGEYRCKIVKPAEEDEEAVKLYYQNATGNSTLDIHKTDANNVLLACGAARVLSLINNAEEIPLESLIDIFDAPDFNILEVDYTPTGLKDFDSQIYGLVPSTLNLFLGKSGLGKSSLVSQIVAAEAIEHGKKVFWVSMESQPSQTKDWLVSQLCSREHMVEYVSRSGFHYYKPTNEAKQAIAEYYRGKVYLYDNLLLTNPDSLIEKMKYSYKRCGTTVYIIDNLMCLNFNGASESETSGRLVEWFNKLINFTKNYGITTSLIVHPRKGAVGVSQPLTQQDIAGSANVGNLCDRLFSIEKPFDQDIMEMGFDRELCVLKDRPLARAGSYSGLYYDKVTRRLRGHSDDPFKKYSWDDGSIRYSSEQYNGGLIVGHRELDIDRARNEATPY